MESELDEFNDETFGEAEIGDWELEHEKFVLEYDADKLPPNPSEIPKIWETADLSDFWSAGDLDVSQSYDSVLNFEESVDKLVREEELEDPAILNVSKHAPRSLSEQTIPVAPLINPDEIWAAGPLQSSFKSIYSSNRRSEDTDGLLDLLPRQLNTDLCLSESAKVCQNPSVKSPTESHTSSHLECYKKGLSESGTRVPPQSCPPGQPQPLLGLPMIPPDQFHKLLHSSPGLVSQQGFLPNSLRPPMLLSRLHPMPPRPGLLIGPPGPHIPYSQFATPPPPFISSATPLSSSNLPKPFPMSPNVPHQLIMQQLPQRQPLPQFSHPYPLDGLRPLDVLSARIEAEQPDKLSFDPRIGSWMSPQDQLLVLNSQLKLLNIANPYMEDYYFAVKFLRLLTKLRESKLAQGALPSLVPPPPYVGIPAPITSVQLLSPDHPHRIALRCRFVITLVRRRRPLPSTTGATSNPASTKSYVDSSDDRSATTELSSPSGATPVSATQLGRPTKSNINSQRVIADFSVATALDEERDERFRTEAEEVASLLKAANGVPAKKNSVELMRPSAQYQAVVAQRRRLVVLARIERLYATVLNIDETNVSLARIFVRNDESRHLMGHRLNLLKVLHRDLFIVKHTSPDQTVNTTVNYNGGSSGTITSRHFAVEIFEVPKGVRLFPLILRFLFPEDRQFCVAEFISQFAKISKSIQAGIDSYAQILYPPCRDVIYKGAEASPNFIPSCLQLPLSSSATVSPSDALIQGELEPNAVAMFSSRLGVSFFFCLMDACARNSQRDDPNLFCELFVYACRIVGELEQRGKELPTPLERFTHFAQLDPGFLMPRRLAAVYEANALARCGATLRQLAIRLPPAASFIAPTGPITPSALNKIPPPPTPLSTPRPQAQSNPPKGLSLA